MQRQCARVGSHPLRHFSTARLLRSSWSPGPAPPRLPKEDQDVFEQLQRQSTGAFSTPRERPSVKQSPQSNAADEPSLSTAPRTSQSSGSSEHKGSSQPSVRVDVKSGEELHPNVRRGAPPEFEGNTNPKTGEVGGPKNEPLRWGQGGDWSYNGRVSDF